MVETDFAAEAEPLPGMHLLRAYWVYDAGFSLQDFFLDFPEDILLGFGGIFGSYLLLYLISSTHVLVVNLWELFHRVVCVCLASLDWLFAVDCLHPQIGSKPCVFL
jgi:hypothetical protein